MTTKALVGDGGPEWDDGLTLLNTELDFYTPPPDGYNGWPAKWSQPGAGLPETVGGTMAFTLLDREATLAAVRKVFLIRGIGGSAVGGFIPLGFG
jgi:hypothetical protein